MVATVAKGVKVAKGTGVWRWILSRHQTTALPELLTPTGAAGDVLTPSASPYGRERSTASAAVSCVCGCVAAAPSVVDVRPASFGRGALPAHPIFDRFPVEGPTPCVGSHPQNVAVSEALSTSGTLNSGEEH